MVFSVKLQFRFWWGFFFLFLLLFLLFVWQGETKSTPSPKTEVWTLDWSLTKYRSLSTSKEGIVFWMEADLWLPGSRNIREGQALRAAIVVYWHSCPNLEIFFPLQVLYWKFGHGVAGLCNNQTLFLYLRFASLNSDTLRSLTAAPQSDLNLDYWLKEKLLIGVNNDILNMELCAPYH